MVYAYSAIWRRKARLRHVQFIVVKHGLINNNEKFPICRVPSASWFSPENQRKVAHLMRAIAKRRSSDITCPLCIARLESAK